MKLRKRIAAVAAAMVMAVCTMATSASAVTETNLGVMSGTLTKTISGNYASAEATATNLMSGNKLMFARARILNSSGVVKADAYNSGVAATNGKVSSGTTSQIYKSSAQYATLVVNIYNGTTPAVGIYDTIEISSKIIW